jgi:hypothetical protein
MGTWSPSSPRSARETPYAEEIEGWQQQRGVMLARLATAERERDALRAERDALRAWQRDAVGLIRTVVRLSEQYAIIYGLREDAYRLLDAASPPSADAKEEPDAG